MLYLFVLIQCETRNVELFSSLVQNWNLLKCKETILNNFLPCQIIPSPSLMVFSSIDSYDPFFFYFAPYANKNYFDFISQIFDFAASNEFSS